MSLFTNQQYDAAKDAAKSGNNTKIGYFKLKNDKDQALVRFDVATIDDLIFALLHASTAANVQGINQVWPKIDCLNTLGAKEDNCPICRAVAEGNTTFTKATKYCYVKMLVSYKDAATGAFSAPTPVVWERKAGFKEEISTKLGTYGDLRNYQFIITRNGAAKDMKTTYSIDVAPEQVFKPTMIPADFSAFENFNIGRHSYWMKSADDMNTFLATGIFPEVVKQTQEGQTQTNESVQQQTTQAPTPDKFAQFQGAVQGPQGMPQGMPQGTPQTPNFDQAANNPFPGQVAQAPAQQASAVEQPAQTQGTRTWFE